MPGKASTTEISPQPQLVFGVHIQGSSILYGSGVTAWGEQDLHVLEGVGH